MALTDRELIARFQHALEGIAAYPLPVFGTKGDLANRKVPFSHADALREIAKTALGVIPTAGPQGGDNVGNR